jgi:glycerol kinase
LAPDTEEVIGDAMEQRVFRPKDLAAIGITNQRGTTVLWNCKTGNAIYNAVVWQDTRTEDYVAEFSRNGGQDRFRAQTGLPLAAYFSGLKIHWILNNVPGARDLAASGDLFLATSIPIWSGNSREV